MSSLSLEWLISVGVVLKDVGFANKFKFIKIKKQNNDLETTIAKGLLETNEWRNSECKNCCIVLFCKNVLIVKLCFNLKYVTIVSKIKNLIVNFCNVVTIYLQQK
jgi:hypothetical protein